MGIKSFFIKRLPYTVQDYLTWRNTSNIAGEFSTEFRKFIVEHTTNCNKSMQYKNLYCVFDTKNGKITTHRNQVNIFVKLEDAMLCASVSPDYTVRVIDFDVKMRGR